MHAHDSIKEFYEQLCQKNPLIGNFHQIATEYPKYINPELAHPLPFRPAYLSTVKQSMVYRGCSEPILECVNSKLKFVQYYVLFMVGTEPVPNIQFVVRDPIMRHYGLDKFHGCYFYSEFFDTQPADIRITITGPYHLSGFPCDINRTCVIGDYCHPDIRNWCQSCFQDFYACDLLKIMHKNLPFSKFPNESLIHIDRVELPIDYDGISSLTNVHRLLSNEEDKIRLLNSKIENFGSRVRETIMAMLMEKEKDDAKLKDMLAPYGGSFDSFLGIFQQVDEQIDDAEDRRIIKLLNS